MDKKIIIAGTGRSGTSFLVALLTELGFDTGFTKDNYIDVSSNHCKAGLEHDSIEDKPYILKNPVFSLHIPELIQKADIDIIYIPYRNIHEVALSRIKNGSGDGGLWLTENPEEQYDKLCHAFGKLIADAISYHIPYVIIDFREINSPTYLFRQMAVLLRNTRYVDFVRAHEKITPLFKR